MVLKRKEGDLCSAYRPQTFSDVVGQKNIIKSIMKSIVSNTRSQCFLFHGASGIGKTTVARILAMAVNCTDLRENGDPCCECSSCTNIINGSNTDVKEINAADTGGKDYIRFIQQDIRSRPMFGKAKVYILDEAHQMTSAAQEALLKGTEDMSEGIYIVLCSTAPSKIKKTLRNRCEDYKFGLLSSSEIYSLIETVSLFEGVELSAPIISAIKEVAAGRARNALKTLQKVLNLQGESEQDILSLIGSVDAAEESVFELCKMLMPDTRAKWQDIMKQYKKLNMEKESIRLLIAGWYRGHLERATAAGWRQDKVCLCLEVFDRRLEDIKPENSLVSRLYRVYKIMLGTDQKVSFIHVKQ